MNGKHLITLKCKDLITGQIVKFKNIPIMNCYSDTIIFSDGEWGTYRFYLHYMSLEHKMRWGTYERKYDVLSVTINKED